MCGHDGLDPPRVGGLHPRALAGAVCGHQQRAVDAAEGPTPCDLAPGVVDGRAIGSVWHDVAAGEGREGILCACLVAPDKIGG